ncbi:MAG: cysteine--tRNA ligase [Planctomycetales bacterium]|nr:cysteine--tRNA ligase [Planctomycetales bacterium]
MNLPRLTNTLTRQVEPLAPLAPPKVGLYTCGPTVYARVHIGNLRTFLAYDLVARTLRARGADVVHVMNVTDVDDRTLDEARRRGVPLREVTDRHLAEFLADLDALRVVRPAVMPRATEHIPDMVALVRSLEARGHTYEADGSVYFRIATLPGYGKLSRLPTSGLKAGARVSHDHYSKEEARDFVLWKAWTPDDGDVAWDAPFGRGRPGWHLECSAMSRHYLGETLDVHMGGVDLVFPHHENEIAQSEGATGKPFVRHFVHTGFVNLEAVKMSKSLGNVRTLDAVRTLGLAPEDFRYWALSVRYRDPIVFSEEGLVAAARARADLVALRKRLREATGEGTGPGTSAAAAARSRLDEALDDDLNVSAALAALHELKTEMNRLLGRGELARADADAAEAAFAHADGIFGCFAVPGEEATPADVSALVLERETARKRRDFAASDRIRKDLAARGWAVEDTPAGPKVRRAGR